MVVLDKEQIKNVIPHREPFLLIDEINELEIGISATATKYIKNDEFWFAGHFPEHPVTPGVLLVEMIAQTGAVCILSKDEYKGKIAFFAGIDNAKFRRPVLPGDTLTLKITIEKVKLGVGYGKGTATVDGELCVSTDIKFAIR